jgi:hypothetical protein
MDTPLVTDQIAIHHLSAWRYEERNPQRIIKR